MINRLIHILKKFATKAVVAQGLILLFVSLLPATAQADYNSSLAALEKCAPKEAQEIQGYINDMQELSRQTNKDWWDTYGKGTPEGRHEKITEVLKDLRKQKKCDETVILAVSKTTAEMAKEITSKWEQNAREAGDTSAAENRQEELAKIEENAKLRQCPLVSETQAKYNAGCWSCLVMEKLISAFLHAANKGLAIMQKAGIMLLIIGTALWLAFWGLKNVSSFTELKLGNIINDLIKFFFKVAIAYWFIIYSPTAISKYFITPMMSVGAIIAEQFWDSEIEQYTEEYEEITDEDYAEMEKEVGKIAQQVSTPVPQKKTETTKTVTETPASAELSAEEQAQDKAASEQNAKNFAKSAIPNLMIPGVRGGVIASGAGCRPKSATGGKGSKCHKGVDVGVTKGKGDCIQYVASGPGTLTYTAMGGYGRVAMINHGKVGKYTWVTTYNHMSSATERVKQKYGLTNGSKVQQGTPIGCAGGSGGKRDKNGVVHINDGAWNLHVHFEVFAVDGSVGSSAPLGEQVDPLALAAHEIVFMRDICPRCNGKNRYTSAAATRLLDGCVSATNNWTCRKKVPENGWAAGGEAIVALNAANLSISGEAVDDGAVDYSSLIVSIPEVKYTGPTNIMPKSVMNSILGAIRAITGNTAGVMTLGDVIRCYSTMPNGGAWNLGVFGHWTNWFTWLQGFILWCMGFMLTCAVAYYLLDVSFKIGFAVLAIPLVMGLWPFNVTKGKLFVALSIIAKAAATFAFLAITTRFGMEMIKSSFVHGLDEVYAAMDALSGSEEENEKLQAFLDQEFALFSTTTIILMFSLIYFFKLVQSTTSDVVNKFFPDQAFGDSSPMHKGATMMTSFAKNVAMKATGADMVKDIVAHQAGRLADGTLRGAAGAIRHPARTARAIGTGAAAATKKTISAAKATGTAVRHPIQTVRNFVNKKKAEKKAEKDLINQRLGKGGRP